MPPRGDPGNDLNPVRRAFADGIAEGLREHLPGGVGILVKGGAACVVAAVLHLALGLDVPTSLLGGAASGAGAVWASRR